MRNRYFHRFILLFLPAFLSISCRSGHANVQSGAGNQTEKKTQNSTPSGRNGSSASDSEPRAALLAMANKVWSARVDRDCKTIAQYLDPNEYGEQTPEERLEVCQNDMFRYQKFRLGQVEVEGQYGWVYVEYETKLAPYQAEPAQEVQSTEKWRLTQGQWYPVAARLYETCPESPAIRNVVEEARLRERFDSTWKMRLARNWSELYQTTDPRDRAKVSESAYAESEGLIEYYESEVDWVQVIGDVGEIRVTYNNRLADPNMTKLNPRKINLSEHWIKRNGEWYRDLIRTK